MSWTNMYTLRKRCEWENGCGVNEQYGKVVCESVRLFWSSSEERGMQITERHTMARWWSSSNMDAWWNVFGGDEKQDQRYSDRKLSSEQLRKKWDNQMYKEKDQCFQWLDSTCFKQHASSVRAKYI